MSEERPIEEIVGWREFNTPLGISDNLHYIQEAATTGVIHSQAIGDIMIDDEEEL